MSRTKPHAGAGALACVAMFLGSSATFAAKRDSCDHTVVGIGDPMIDKPALQAAIYGPHSTETVTVCVSGTLALFNGVVINPKRSDPEAEMSEFNLVGLDAPAGKATIQGGYGAIYAPHLSELRRLRIDNLRIRKATGVAISIVRTNELLEISNVDIEGIDSAHIVLPDLEFSVRQGIVVHDFPFFPESRITGKIITSDTTVDGGTYLNAIDK